MIFYFLSRLFSFFIVKKLNKNNFSPKCVHVCDIYLTYRFSFGIIVVVVVKAGTWHWAASLFFKKKKCCPFPLIRYYFSLRSQTPRAFSWHSSLFMVYFLLLWIGSTETVFFATECFLLWMVGWRLVTAIDSFSLS